MCACLVEVLWEVGQYSNRAKGMKRIPHWAQTLWGKMLRSSERAVLRAPTGDYRRTANSWMTDQRRH